MQGEGYRRCTKCGETKPPTEFYSNGVGKPPRPECKACNRARRAQYRAENPEKVREINARQHAKDRASGAALERERAWRERNREHARNMARAHMQVWRAVQRGQIDKPLACALCAADGPLHAHHEDYARPLDVIWLCRSCHMKRHHGNPEYMNAG
jgi:hypothetical protein